MRRPQFFKGCFLTLRVILYAKIYGICSEFSNYKFSEILPENIFAMRIFLV